MFAVSGSLLTRVINSLPDIFGICMSVTMRSGCKRAALRELPAPLVADSTVKPRSSRIAAHGVADQHRIVDDQSHQVNSHSKVRHAHCPGCDIARAIARNKANARAGDYLRHPAGATPAAQISLSWVALFDVHVFEFAGLEDLAAFQALDEFGVFIAAHDLHTRVLARLSACLRFEEEGATWRS